jgi:hypothetical protein
MPDEDLDIEIPDINEDIGLGDEDKNRVQSNKLDWYKGEKGRTDRIALVYFSTYEAIQLRVLLKEKPELTLDQQRAVVKKIRTNIATKLNKSVDQLEPVDLLDLREARFKPASAVYKEGLGFLAWPKEISAAEEKIWAKVGERKDYVVTLVLWYPTDREGEIDKDRLAKGWRVLPWRTTPEMYGNLRRIHKGLASDGSSISQIDLNLTCGDTNFQKNTVSPAGSAIYLKNENFKKMVLEKAYSLYSKLSPFRQVTTDELREKLGLASSGVSVSVGSDLTDEDFSGILGNV